MFRGKPRVAFVSSPEQARKVRNTDRLVMCGHVVFAALSSSGIKPPNDAVYIEQPERPTTNKILGKSNDALKVWINATMLDEAKRFKSTPALALDYYIKLGFSKRIDTIVMGGIETDDRTVVNVLVFKRGNLVHIEEKNLATTANRQFGSQLEIAISDITGSFKGFDLLVASPLNDFSGFGVRTSSYIDAGLFSKRIYVEFNYGGELSFYKRYGIALGATSLFAIIYVFVIGADLHGYIESKRYYNKIIGENPEFNETRLILLGARRSFLDTKSNDQAVYFNVINSLSRAVVNEDNVRITKIAIGDISGYAASSTAKFVFEAEVLLPADYAQDQTLLQIHPVLMRISKAMAMKATLKLVRSTSTSDTTSGRKNVKILVEGS